MASDEIALVVQARGTISGDNSVPHTLAAFGSDGERCVIRHEQVGAFLMDHRDRTLVCHDAPSLHWTILDFLGPTPAACEIEALWRFSREDRLVDVRLLDQLLGIARGESDPKPQSLGELAASHDIKLGNGEVGTVPVAVAAGSFHTSSPPRAATPTFGIADAILAIYLRLRDEAVRILQELGIDPVAAGRFGLLGLGSDVRGAIALARAPRTGGLRVRVDLLPELDELCSSAFRENSRRLGEDPRASRCFRWDGQVVAIKKGRFPDRIKDNLEGWLERTAADVTGLHAIPFEPPRSRSGRVASDPDCWGIEARCHPLLAAWLRLMTAATLRWGLTQLDLGGDRRLRPRYEVIPAIRSTTPNLMAARLLHPMPMFEAAPGNAMLLVELRCLELRCVAEVTGRNGGESQLGGWFLAGIDPVVYTAAMLHDFNATNWREFLALELENPATYRRWLIEARVFLLAAVRGLTESQEREILQQDHGLDVDAATARQYSEYLMNQANLECPYHRAQDTFEAVRSRLRCEPEELAELMIEGEAEDSEAALRNLIAGRTRSPAAFERLHAICRDPDLQECLATGVGSRDLYEVMFAAAVLTPTGRVRGRMFFTQARSALFLDLADAIRKSVLYALASRGYEPAGCVDDEIILEVPADAASPDVLQAILEVVNEAASWFLGCVNDLCTVRRVEAW